ncbi:MAG: Rieske 2Fe-2S domain-containing protein [Anaerolineales bacterium]|nr:Rieske 2Fe-2S domain-containing protein [Anaerolineales bacterium]MCB0012452.1 Rieske 2Fe-2S domain-containing protein [Anaerolineales bacterium]MCB0018892.1 Rieske 2Fe-2S domain-containing protein [Anaerolineales bacterium]MCB0029386.1 Rieske 2Fe-2S domain-containing protein [Anaerolineales bacterium]MCB8960714.1 Rieske 2Fe-2S domain-containing protein [Ardenticatenales bacterium]
MAEAGVKSSAMTRREFLFYIWIASLAVFTAEVTGLIIWFAIPRFREGEFGGRFNVLPAEVPEVNTPPVSNAAGRFWLVNVDSSVDAENDLMYPAPDESGPPIKGVAAIYKVCTHLGCIYAWNDANSRFECPCHGSKYRLDGRRVESPAPRTLDRFKVIALDASGTTIGESPADENGFYQPLDLNSLNGTVATLQVDTGDRKDGPTQPLLCDIKFGYC